MIRLEGWFHKANQMELCFSNYGQFARSASGNPGLWWPRGSGLYYAHGAGLWFGVIDGGDTLVTIGFTPIGAVSEFCPGLSGMEVSNPNAVIYMYPNDWPPPLNVFPMARQNRISNQDSWCCYNDSNPAQHCPGDTRPIGVEIYQSIYVWDMHLIEDVIFVKYEIKNVSHGDLQNCYFGICIDPEFSYGSQSQQATAILKRVYFVNGDYFVIDNLAYSWEALYNVGAVGIDLL